MSDLLFRGSPSPMGKLFAQVIHGREKTRKKAVLRFEDLVVGEKVQTNKDYLRCCGNVPLRGIVVGKEILSDQKELDERYPYLYASTNPYVIHVQTQHGETAKLNVVWLERVR